MVSFNRISIPSSFGHVINNLFLKHDQAASHLVVLLPGMYNTHESPLLYYSANVALQAGCDVLGIEYGYHHSGHSYSSEMFESTLGETLEALRSCGIEQYHRVSFISKSFGTIIAGEATRHFTSVKAHNLFLTPIARTIPYINEGDCTVIFGTADPLFSQDDADKISGNVQVISLPGADHSLTMDNDYRKSLDFLGDVCEIVNKFLK